MMYRYQGTRHKFPTPFALRVPHRLIPEMRRANGEEDEVGRNKARVCALWINMTHTLGI